MPDAWGRERLYTVEVPEGLVRKAEGLGLTLDRQLVRTAIYQYLRQLQSTRAYKRQQRANPEKNEVLKAKRRKYYYDKEKSP